MVCGDFNTAHRPIDLARPKANEENSGFLPIERAWVDRFIAAGYVDTFRHIHGDEPHQSSWWSYKQRARVTNVGWRIDYFFVSEELAPAIRDAVSYTHLDVYKRQPQIFENVISSGCITVRSTTVNPFPEK